MIEAFFPAASRKKICDSPRMIPPQLLASLESGNGRLRVPLSFFYCASVRRALEVELERRDQHPQWELASKGVDAAGAPIRFVPVIRVEDFES
jgi:hypothetical protein